MTSPPRYSERRFPPYRHLPGKTPHPTRAPQGHSYGRDLTPFDVDDRSWPHCDGYLFAIDLFNHGYYWEAHEWLEAIWHRAGRDTPIGSFAQGTIQAAAALLKHSMGESASAKRLAVAAGAKLRRGAAVVLGVDTRALADDLEAFVAGRHADSPRIVLSHESLRR